MTSNSVYLAARFSRAAEMRKRAGELKARGFNITSDWIYGLEPEGKREIAMKDCADIERADALINFTEEPRDPMGTGCGRHVELGLALKKRVIIVGPRENVFCHLPEATHLPEWSADEAAAILRPDVVEWNYERLLRGEVSEASEPW